MRTIVRWIGLFLAVGLLLGAGLHAQVAGCELERRESVLDGRAFGAAGAYELLAGKLQVALDPADPGNAGIVDLALAPRDADGRVRAVANFMVLQPADPAKRRGTALVEVSNRGGKAALNYFNRGRGGADPRTQADFGDGLLMRLGLTVVWVGWQFDVPAGPGALRLEVPRVRAADGAPITGLVRSDWVVDEPAAELGLGHRGHQPYPVADPDAAEHRLTVRSGRDAARETVPRGSWRFTGNGGIALDGGFRAGRIYELVYRGQDPAVVGMGLAVIRDVASWIKFGADCPFPAARTVAVGISQTGRFLRLFLYQGFHRDLQGRPCLDGVLAYTAGGGRGSFNHRFAQPSRDAHRYSAFFYPTDLFPFASRLAEDPLSGRLDGLFAHGDPESLPRTFWINTGYEYWGRAAALIHVEPDGSADLAPTGRERIYHMASAQHFPGGAPRGSLGDGPAPVLRGNPLDLRAPYRALLVRMLAWIEDGTLPPPSRYPRLADGSLVPVAEYAGPGGPGLAAPRAAHVAYRADYGPRWELGIVDRQPPELGAAFPALVPQVDGLGRERGGVQNLELAAPVATYLPWHLRAGLAGGNGELADFVGAFAPLPRDERERTDWNDSRPSLAALYPGGIDTYRAVAQDAAGKLVAAGFLLQEDRADAVERAERLWERAIAR
ncbi:MAG TPA: alpha/beta hydrolase domain-containing protein [Planctomycetota bacterium]